VYYLLLLLPPFINKRRYERRPARLMRRPETGSIVTMKVLVKKHIVAPVWILLELAGAAINRSAARAVTHENPNQAVGDFPRHPREGNSLIPGTRNPDAVARAVRFGQLAQRFDQQEVRRKPDRPPPV